MGSYIGLLLGHSVWKSQKKSHLALRAKREAKKLKRKSEACGQTLLPDSSILIGQKLAENAKIEKLECVIWGNSKWTKLLDKLFCVVFGQ